MNFLFLTNPKSAVVGIPVAIIGLIITGFTLSYPELAQAKLNADRAQKALDRAESCSVVDRIHEGQYYASREVRPDGKTWETLLPDGNLICSVDGATAMINGGVATFIRKTSSTDMVKKFTSRFGVDENGQTIIPKEFKAAKSTIYVANFAKRPPAAPGKKEPGLMDWLFPTQRSDKPTSASIKNAN